MTPEERIMLKELYAWMQARKVQQIAFPLDDTSKNALGTPLITGLGSFGLTDTITIGAGGGSANVPKAYQDTFILVSGGVQYEVPFLRTI